MTLTIEEAAQELTARLDIQIPNGESPEAHRLAIARLVRRDGLKEQLLRAVANGTLRIRYPEGGYLPDGSQFSESSQVDINEAQAALENNGEKFISPNQQSQPQSINDSALVCKLAELSYNGEDIQWGYWLDRISVTSRQAAKLAFCIDPIKWPNDDCKLGKIPPSLAEKIERLEEWLGERNSSWTLSKLVVALGDGMAPISMKTALQHSNHSSGLPASEEPWKAESITLGKKYIQSWRDAGFNPTKQDVAFYLEGEFSTRGIYGKREEVLDAAYIERHALTGITGNKSGHKSKKPKVPEGKRGQLPEFK